jgi:glycosyltransferase involved in cell wall biosynthesis
VIVSTGNLRNQILPLNANTVVLPNYLDERLWCPPESSAPPPGEQVRLLYAGTLSHRKDLEFLGQVVTGLRPADRKRIQIDVIGAADGSKAPQWCQVVPVPSQVAASYPLFVRWLQAQNRWHWALAPLLDTPFNRSKSALKFLEYSALGLPSICSDVPAYRSAVRNGETGILAINDAVRWRESLESTLSDNSCLDAPARPVPVRVSRQHNFSRKPMIKSVWRSLLSEKQLTEAQEASR